MWAICLRIVRMNRIMKYIRRIGQNTGMSRKGKKVQKMEIRKALVVDSLPRGHWVSMVA